MPPPLSPYDHTTPPMTPKFYAGPTPRLPFHAQTPGYTRRPEAAAVWQHGPHTERTVPCGYEPRDGIDYNIARDAQFNTFEPDPYYISPFFKAYKASCKPKMNTRQHALPRVVIPTETSEMMFTRAPRELQVFDGTEHMAKHSKTKSVSKTPEWLASLTQKKRRPSALFNKNFGFDVASRRAPSDRTPQISPRTSICQAQLSSPISPTDSVKRQRVDSTSADMVLGFPFGKATPTKSTRGRDLGSPAMSPRNSIAPATPPPSSRHGTMSSEEVHPGTPVDWGTPSLPDEDSSYKSSDTYYPPLTPEARRRSFPSISLPAERKHSKEVGIIARLAVLDTTTKPFGAPESSSSTTAITTTTSSGRKRACTVEFRERTSRKIGPESSPSSATSSKSMRECERAARTGPCVPGLQRATSDPSTEAFLKHVRASLEKRRTRDAREKGRDVVVDYPVFADEHEKGFLDDAPL
ncbi:hypothetical protein J1614_001974 [Plenodomus biglobosus]|nr:hypothetical protein J1614_001974 [Plenodomus biglobosus]